MNRTIERWNKISEKGMKHHMYYGASLYRHVPMVALILFFMEMTNNYRAVSMTHLIINIVVKLFIAYGIGIVIGKYEWQFLEKAVNDGFENNKAMKINYALTYGVLMFGSALTLAMADPFFMTTSGLIRACMVYPLAGLLWGAVMSIWISKETVG